ncbi:MAG TPA: aspartate/glutamate racemase family protein [Candidatus Saccharimonadales bacterium]
MRLGIFDSGRGGEFVAEKLKSLLPAHEYIVVNDLAHAPYGERSYEEIQKLTEAAIQSLLACDIIVIACNTATAGAIDYLRLKHPDKIFVGFEPMIKPAANATKSNRITLLATRATAYSTRTEQLITDYAQSMTIDRPSTLGWAKAIDEDHEETIDLTEVKRTIDNGSDVIIIGCTHYIALQERLEELFPSTQILEPTEAVANQISQLTSS